MIYPSLEQRLQDAVRAVLPDLGSEVLSVRPCPDARFGDYQAPGLMALAKARGMNPRQLAQEVLRQLDVSEWCGSAEIAGPGFVNFRVLPRAVTQALLQAAQVGGQFFQKADKPRTVVVDFSSPNVAKPMHVGHIRSTILGECLARVFRLLGHRVITDNHIGDWGTQFGKLLVGWKTDLNEAALADRPLEEMERLYKKVNADGECDPAVLDRARSELVKLQQGDEENLAIWRRMIEISRGQFDRVYRRLGVTFDHAHGESFYNDRLKAVVGDLVSRGLVQESEGALVAFFNEASGLAGHPAIVRKSDGAANYATTDLATLQFRTETWKPDDILYVTDGRQQLHFRQVFALFQSWHPEVRTRLHHVWFGSILGEDGKPFKTRSGDTVKLDDLLDEAEDRAYRVVLEKNPDMAEDERRDIARIVGLGAVKYADLLPSRQSDYVFSWDKMLALHGNTAPYLQYAYTRIRGIFRRGGISGTAELPPVDADAVLTAPEELELAKHLLNYGLVLDAVAEEQRPNLLCNYLYDLAGRFARFFEQCPVLKADGDSRSLRLILCDMTARVLQQGLELLGIETSDRM